MFVVLFYVLFLTGTAFCSHFFTQIFFIFVSFKAFNIKKCETLCGSKTTRYAEVCALLRDHQKVEPALIVLDRNLGHGINTSGERVEMPTGDIVSMRLRERGIDCCLILLTGDSCEQLEQYSRLLKGHFIDLVLDKHHLPSYIYIFEKYSKSSVSTCFVFSNRIPFIILFSHDILNLLFVLFPLNSTMVI